MVNYADYFRNIPNPSEQMGRSIQNVAAMKQSQLKIQELKQNQERAQQMQADLTAVAQNPSRTPKDFADLMVKYPSLASNLKESYDLLTSEQQRTKMSQSKNIYAAIASKQYDVAERLIESQKQAAENVGDDQEATALEALLRITKMNPEAALMTAGINLSATMGPEGFGEFYEKLSSTEIERQLAPGK